jgi:uncharacterized protein
MAGQQTNVTPAATSASEPRRAAAITFGLDRIGLWALAAPWLSLALIVLLTALAAWSVTRLKVDDSLSELFRTNTAEFRQYEEIDRRFPSSEFDVLVVIEGKDLLKRPQIEAVRRAIVELQLADGVGGLVSMLSARGKPDASGYAAPIVPDTLPTDAADYDAVVKRLTDNEVVKGKFLSDDGTLAMGVISLDRDAVKDLGLGKVVTGIRETVEKELKGSGLKVQLTGAPVMQLEIRNAVERDRLLYNGLGFLLGAGLAYLFFRRLSLTLIAVMGPTIAILWTLGLISGLDFRLNLFINVLTPLILVSGFSDSMHLVFAIRRDIVAGVDRLTAARNAVSEVAPACLLTAMNQALSIVSFAFAESALIRTFGLAALLAVGISYLAVAVVVPTLAALLIRREAAPAGSAADAHGDSAGIRFLDRISTAISGFAARNPVPFLAAGVAAVVLTGLAYTRLVPHYRLADQVPDREQALSATGRIDQKLTGANPIHVMIQWKDADLYDPKTIAVIEASHKVMETVAGLGNVWSLESLRRWLKDAGDERIDTVKSYVKVLPEHLVRRFIDKEQKAVLVTGRMPDVDASQILPVVDKITAALDVVRNAHPGYQIDVTGLPAIAARNSAKLIGELNWGLVGDIFLIFIFLGLMLRSVLAGVSSVLPSLLPIFATGALLWWTGEGLQFASIVAITVAFSLAIDSTIHFLNRYRIEERALGPGAGHAAKALATTISHIGPAVMLTTAVLALGLGVTMFSDLPSLRLFGRLAAFCLGISLVAQLLILPATVAIYRRIWPLKA